LRAGQEEERRRLTMTRVWGLLPKSRREREIKMLICSRRSLSSITLLSVITLHKEQQVIYRFFCTRLDE